MSAPLKLIALDADDLAVISTHVQDARVQAGDIIWRQGDKRLVVGMSRLDWEQTLEGETEPHRRLAALRFDRVLACKSRNIDIEAPGRVLDLVGLEFHPHGGEEQGGLWQISPRLVDRSRRDDSSPAHAAVAQW